MTIPRHRKTYSVLPGWATNVPRYRADPFTLERLPRAYPPQRAKTGLAGGSPAALGSIIPLCGLLKTSCYPSFPFARDKLSSK